MKALLAVTLLSAAAQAQNAPAATAPQATIKIEEPGRAKLAVEALKKYTDQFRVPGGDPFPAPPPIKTSWTAKEVDRSDFGGRADFWDFKKCASDYRQLFDWWEDGSFGEAYENPACFAKSVHLDPERFQVAYGLNSARGTDLAAGGRWVCGFADALRGYFLFHNELEGGARGGRICRETWGIGTAPVDQMHGLNGWISARYKEASGVDLGQGEKNALNYASVSQCVAEVEAKTKEQIKEKPTTKNIPSLMHKPDPEQTFLKEDLSDIDFEKYDYWLFYFDASWQPWQYIARTTKRDPSAEGLKKMIKCRYPTWVGNFISRAPKNAKYELKYFPKGGVTLRHPGQPNKAAERDQELIKKNKKFCK